MHTKITEFIFCWLIFHEHRACPGMWLIQPVYLHERKCCFLFQEWVTNNFLLRGGTLWPLPLLCAGNLFYLNLSKSYICSHNLYEFKCTSHVVSRRHYFFGVIHHIWILQSFYILFHIDSLSLSGMTKTSHLGVSAPKSYGLHIVQL